MDCPQNHTLSNEMERATILIAEGEYHETVNVTRKGPLTLLVIYTSIILIPFLDHMNRVNFLLILSTPSNVHSPMHSKHHLDRI